MASVAGRPRSTSEWTKGCPLSLIILQRLLRHEGGDLVALRLLLLGSGVSGLVGAPELDDAGAVSSVA
jgi:hypothetical protein